MNKLPTIQLQKDIFPLKNKLIIFFIIFFILIIGSSAYLNLAYRTSSLFFQKLLSENRRLDKLSEELQKTLLYTESYLSQAQPGDLKGLYQTIEQIEVLNEEIRADNYDLYQIINTILNQARSAVNARNNSTGYYQYHSRLQQNISLAQTYIVRLINQNTREGNDSLAESRDHLRDIEQKTIILSALTGILSLLFVLIFSINITNPLNKIMKSARKISSGNFNVAPIRVDTNDELRSIAMVFNQMSEDIRNLFTELKEKIGLERELQEEKMENLRISNLLNEAEIKRLQSQINPHFLYNTLNTISQVAILEEADETGELIKKIASLLRYNLKKGDKLVPLREEIHNTRLYFEIMKVRYGGKIKLRLNYKPELENLLIPGMILQPLVENSLLHGFKNQPEGEILIQLQKESEYLEVKVKDNGRGIDQKEIEKIIEDKDAGISGLRNIRYRLKLYMNREKKDISLPPEPFQIKSEPDEYTEIRIRIPLLKEVPNNCID